MRKSKEEITETLYNEQKARRSVAARIKSTALRLGGAVLACTVVLTGAFALVPAFRETVERGVLTATLAVIFSAPRKQETETEGHKPDGDLYSTVLPGIGRVWYAAGAHGTGAEGDSGELSADDPVSPTGTLERVTLGKTLAALLDSPEPGRDDRFAVTWRIYGYDSDDVYNAITDEYGKCVRDYNEEAAALLREEDTEQETWISMRNEWENAARLEIFEGKAFADWFEIIKELPEEEQTRICDAWEGMRKTFRSGGYTYEELEKMIRADEADAAEKRQQINARLNEIHERQGKLSKRIGDTFFERFCTENSITPTEEDRILYLTKAQIEGLRGVDGLYVRIDAFRPDGPVIDDPDLNG